MTTIDGIEPEDFNEFMAERNVTPQQLYCMPSGDLDLVLEEWKDSRRETSVDS